MHKARLFRFGARKAHLGTTFHALRLSVETLGFVLWHTPKTASLGAEPRVPPSISSGKQPQLVLHRSDSQICAAASPVDELPERVQSDRCPNFLVGPTRHYHDLVIRQWPLECHRFIPCARSHTSLSCRSPAWPSGGSARRERFSPSRSSTLKITAALLQSSLRGTMAGLPV